MPCYAYDENQSENIRLQTLGSDVYEVEHIIDLDSNLAEAQNIVQEIKTIRLKTIEKDARKHRLHVHMSAMHHQYRSN